jgi:mannose-6-phosphate isomerase-like protein (cupin superfamily)
MKTGTTIKNNLTGETITMLVSEEDNGGARQLYEARVPPRRIGPPLHYHVTFTETFTVKEGTLDFYLGPERRHMLLGPQQSVTAELGQLHTFANERDTVTVITVESKPAGGVAKAFQLAYGLANDGEASKDGLPKSLLVRLVFIRMAGGFVPGVPIAVQKFALGLAATLARVTGVEKRLAKYFQ